MSLPGTHGLNPVSSQGLPQPPAAPAEEAESLLSSEGLSGRPTYEQIASGETVLGRDASAEDVTALQEALLSLDPKALRRGPTGRPRRRSDCPQERVRPVSRHVVRRSSRP